MSRVEVLIDLNKPSFGRLGKPNWNWGAQTSLLRVLPKKKMQKNGTAARGRCMVKRVFKI